jgi:hypothetical protein
MLRHADRNGGCHQRFGGFADAARDDLGADRIGADQANCPCCSVDPIGRTIPRLDRR